MRCKTCDYPLWNLKARQCPECGTQFRPSEFEFVLNSVCFCCPLCDQAYYGTGSTGHLVPPRFACVKCGSALDMDDMVLRPAAGVDERRAMPDPMPWLNRAHRGWWKSWFATIGKALFAPGVLMKSVPGSASVGQAWWFMFLTMLAVSAVTTIPWTLVMLVPMMMAGTGGRSGAAGGLAGFAGFMLFLFFFVIFVGTALWGLVAHGLLKMTGATRATLGRTMQAICYSSGANVATAFPCLGLYFGWIWWMISAVFMIKEAQRVSGGRAVLASLTFPIVAVVLLVGGYAAFVIFLMSMIGARVGAMPPGSARTTFGGPAATGQAVSAEESSAKPITIALYNHVITHRGWPEHAIQIVSPDGPVRADQFVLPYSNTDRQLVPVGSATLRDLQFLAAAERDLAVEEAAIALPADTIAYRLGDFVFTYPGIDLSGDTAGLWMAVMCYDPEQNAPPRLPGPIVLGFVDGTTQEIERRELPALLYTQNDLRAMRRLPPLPDPATLTQAQPAAAHRASPAP